MSGQYLGDFVGDETMVVVFDSFDSNGASVTITGLATTDIEIYKGSSITQRASDSGYTLIDTDGIDIDGATGIHGFTVDLSDNTDAGFYATGNDFYIVVNAVTIDTQTVRFIAARFSIQNRYMRGTDSALLAANAPTNFGDLSITAATGRVTVGTNNDKTGYSISGTKTTLDALNDVSTTQVNTEVDTALSDIGLQYIVNTALPTSWTVDITANSALDYIADDGTATFDRTTDSLQAVRDHVTTIKTDTAAILVDTNELQTDWTDGGRLDLILDAILDDTSTSGVVLTTAERNAVADAILDRDMSTGVDSGSTTVRTVRQALRSNRNKVTISGGTLTVYKEDDATASWTASITTTAADPISDINPAGGS